MPDTLQSTTRRPLTPAPLRGRSGERPAAVRRRFDRVAISFWLGGVGLGAAGCILGACMPYRYPVATVLSVLWWGIYFGCLGASLGALGALCLRRPPLVEALASTPPPAVPPRQP
jgi:hypothetical protein